jgi:hypothetical protein
MSFYAVNVGANDGKAADPIYPLLKVHNHFGVLQIEPNGGTFSQLQANMAEFPNVEMLNVVSL